MRPDRYPYSYKHEEFEELEIKGFRIPEQKYKEVVNESDN